MRNDLEMNRQMNQHYGWFAIVPDSRHKRKERIELNDWSAIEDRHITTTLSNHTFVNTEVSSHQNDHQQLTIMTA